MSLKSFTIKDGKAFIDANDTGWIRRDDVICYLMRLKEVWEKQLSCYKEKDDFLILYKQAEGKVLMLSELIKEFIDCE